MSTVKVRNVEIGTGIPKICVPIVGKTKEEILQLAEKTAVSEADIVEWRVDWYEDVWDVKKTLHTAKGLRDVLGDIPVLFTFRTLKEGGEKDIKTEDYVKLNLAAARSGYVDLIDVEVFTGEETVTAIIQGAHDVGVKVVASNHDFHKTPEKEELILRLCKMQGLGADIPKVAVMPQNEQDVLTLLAATEEMVRVHADRPIITMSMSGTGMVSRISGEIFGSAITFGAVGKTSAPGQLNIEELKMILSIIHKNSL